MTEDSLEAARERAEAAIRHLVRQRVPAAKVFSVGAIDIAPELLAIWIVTPTDLQRDALTLDANLEESMRELLREVGYLPKAVPDVAFGFESEETVTRDWSGKWQDAIR